MPTSEGIRRSSLDGRLKPSLRKMRLGRQNSDSVLKSSSSKMDNGRRKSTTETIDRVSFLEVEEDFDNAHSDGFRDSFGGSSGRSMTDVDLQYSERMIAKKKKEMSQKKKAKEHTSSLLNFQNPQYNGGEHKLSGHHNSGPDNVTDNTQEKKKSNELKSDSKNHHRQYPSTKKGPQYSAQCDDSFDLVPTDLYASRREGNTWLTIYLCIIVSLSVILTVIIISVNRGNNSPSVRGNITPPINNKTDSSSPLYVKIGPEEKDLLDSSHNVVKACIEKETDTPKTCQEYCESKECCFEELNCETQLTGDECLSYVACHSWFTERMNSPANDTNDR